MRAAVLPEVHASLAIEDIPTPSPHAGEVLVRVAACGVCHTDLHVIKGEVKFPTPADMLREAPEAYDALNRGETVGRAIVEMDRS